MIARLVLEDGQVFEGNSFGAEGTIIGQVICHTGVVGYEAVATDPGMCGSIAVMTYPLIGNYGINTEELESAAGQVAGLVVQEISRMYSNWTGKQSLESFAREQGIVGISDVDTRRLALYIREHGEQKGLITTSDEDVSRLLDKIRNTDVEEDLVSRVTTKTVRIEEPHGNKVYDIGVLDLGVPRSLVRQLLNAGSRVTIYPSVATGQQILQAGHDGVIVAGGPGSPEHIPYVVNAVKELLGKVPMFGVDLGHLVMATACGGRITRLRKGHYGANKPIRYLGEKERLLIVWESHSFLVDKGSIGKNIRIEAENLIDGSIEALSYMDLPAFSVQYRLNACDNGEISDEVKRFLELCKRR